MKLRRASALLYRSEMLHSRAFKMLAWRERNRRLGRMLLELSAIEGKHALMWKRAGRLRRIREHLSGGLYIWALVLFRRLFGITLAIKLMEYNENKILGSLRNSDLRHRNSAIGRILADEREKKLALESRILGYSSILSNIRDVVFGMNDGLVEILAATAGIGAAIQQPLLVIVAGLIVAISGTLSMTGGAYLSTEYQNTIDAKRAARGPLSPIRSASYVGVSYMLGAIVPLLPFILGMSGYRAISVSIAVTAVVLVAVSSVISVVSDTSISERALKTLLITLGISAITIALGIYARSYMHLAI